MAKPLNLTKQLYTKVKGVLRPTSRRALVRKQRAKIKPLDKPTERPTEKLADRPVVKNTSGARLKSDQAQKPQPLRQKTSGQKPPEMANGARKADLRKALKKTPQPESVPRKGSFWSDLIWVRPWLLVGGLWVTFVVLIAVSLAGLSSPGREIVLAPVTSSIDGQPLSAPDAAAASRLVLPEEDQIVLTQRDPAATLPGAPEQSMPAWPLLVMVAACAGGCMLMSKQGLLTAEPRRARRRGAENPVAHRAVRSVGSRSVGSRPVGSRSTASRPVGSRAAGSRPVGGRKRRAKHRRLGAQRPVSQVMAFRSGQQKIHHTPVQNPPRAAKPVSFAVGHGAATPVTVVPENESSALDWKEGSMAHRLDVRQSRSINSFL